MPPENPKLPFVRDLAAEQAWINNPGSCDEDEPEPPRRIAGALTWLGLLQLMSLGLRVDDIVTWSWWIALTPALIGAVIMLAVGAGLAFLRLAATAALSPRHRRRP